MPSNGSRISRAGAALIAGAGLLTTTSIAAQNPQTLTPFTAVEHKEAFGREENGTMRQMNYDSIYARRRDGSDVHIARDTHTGMPVTSFLNDITRGRYVSYDFKTNLISETPLSAHARKRLTTVFSSCQDYAAPAVGQCHSEPGKVDGWGVVRVKLRLDDGVVVEDYRAPELNYYLVKQVITKGGEVISRTATTITVGEPDASLFDTRDELPRASAGEMLEQAYLARQGSVSEAAKVVIERAEKRWWESNGQK